MNARIRSPEPKTTDTPCSDEAALVPVQELRFTHHTTNAEFAIGGVREKPSPIITGPRIVVSKATQAEVV